MARRDRFVGYAWRLRIADRDIGHLHRLSIWSFRLFRAFGCKIIRRDAVDGVLSVDAADHRSVCGCTNVCLAMPSFAIAATALIATCFDLVLDPGAVRLGFWRYASNIGFYGVPISNFVGWLVTGSIAAIVIEIFLGRVETAASRSGSADFEYFSYRVLLDGDRCVWRIGMAGSDRVCVGHLVGIYWFKYHYRFDDMLVYVDERAIRSRPRQNRLCITATPNCTWRSRSSFQYKRRAVAAAAGTDERKRGPACGQIRAAGM